MFRLNKVYFVPTLLIVFISTGSLYKCGHPILLDHGTDTKEVGKEIKVLSFNVFMYPLHIKHDQDFRFQYFVDHYLDRYDIVGLQEMWDPHGIMDSTSFPQHKDKFYTAVAPHPYIPIPHLHSGLAIISRYPIKKTAFHMYSTGVLPDWFAPKGVLYALVSIGDRDVHVFNTHMQSDYAEGSWEQTYFFCTEEASIVARKSQIREMMEFVKTHYDDVGDLLVMGDLNIDSKSGTGEIEYLDLMEMMNLMIAGEAKPGPSDRMFLDVASHHPVTYPSYNKSSAEERLDYIFWYQHGHVDHNKAVPHQMPIHDTTPMKSEKRSMGTISDHYGLEWSFRPT